MSATPTQDAQKRALFDVYVEVTGRQISFTAPRRHHLTPYVRAGITADDVRSVLKVIKDRVERGIGSHTTASLEWKNAMAEFERFEDRLSTIKAARAQRRVTPKKDTAQTIQVGPGSHDTVTVLDESLTEADIAPIRAKVSGAFAAIKAQISGLEGKPE